MTPPAPTPAASEPQKAPAVVYVDRLQANEAARRVTDDALVRSMALRR